MKFRPPANLGDSWKASLRYGWRHRFKLESHRVGSFLARWMPQVVVDAGVRLLVRALASRNSSRRLMVERNIRRVGGVSAGDMHSAVRQAFIAYARYYIDASVVAKLTPSQVDAGFTFEGFENILDARRRAPGPILALPHVGSWDWAGAWLAQVPGFPVTAVVEEVGHKELFEWMLSYRRRIGMNVLAATPDVLPKLSLALDAGHVICLLCDRNVGAGGVEVEFFGEKIKLPGGAALLARRTGAPIVPAVVYHRGDKRHAVTRPPIFVSKEGNLRETVREATQTLTYELEKMIQVAPSQWHLLQPNWPSDLEALAALRRN